MDLEAPLWLDLKAFLTAIIGGVVVLIGDLILVERRAVPAARAVTMSLMRRTV